MRLQRSCSSILFISVSMFEIAGAQSLPAQSASPPSPQANTLAQKPGAVTISLDEAIQLALQHNHNVLAARTVIQQNEAEETTANLRPNPVLLGDSQFLPIRNGRTPGPNPALSDQQPWIGVVTAASGLWMEDQGDAGEWRRGLDRKSTRLNSSHLGIAYAGFVF